jgi:hypothetical protein
MMTVMGALDKNNIDESQKSVLAILIPKMPNIMHKTERSNIVHKRRSPFAKVQIIHTKHQSRDYVFLEHKDYFHVSSSNKLKQIPIKQKTTSKDLFFSKSENTAAHRGSYLC